MIITRRNIILLSTLLFVVGAGFVHAASQDLILEKGKVFPGNYIASAQTVVIDGTVDRDLILAANQVTITGTINGDVLVVAQNVDMSGTVKGSLRIAAQTIRVGGEVGRNVTILGQDITIASKAIIAWDAFVGANTLTHAGVVNGSIYAAAQKQELSGAIGGGANLAVGNGRLTVSKTAKIAESLSYYSPSDATIEQGAQIRSVTHEVPPMSLPGRRTFFWPIVFLFGAWVVGTVLVTTQEEWVKRMAAMVFARPGKTLLWGIGVWVLTPLIAAVLLFTYIGIPLAILMFVGYGVLIYLTKVITGILLGERLVKFLRYNAPLWQSMLIGIFLYSLLLWLPLVIGLPVLVVPLWVAGSLLTMGAVVHSFAKE